TLELQRRRTGSGGASLEPVAATRPTEARMPKRSTQSPWRQRSKPECLRRTTRPETRTLIEQPHSAACVGHDAPLIDEGAATRGRGATEAGDERAGGQRRNPFALWPREPDRTAGTSTVSGCSTD